jgi:type IV pilus assembly protein PilB
VLLLAMADPTNVNTIDDVAMLTGRRVRPVAASVEDLDILLTKMARMDEAIEDIAEEEEDLEREPTGVAEEDDADAPIIKLVHSLVAQAVAQRASDIHINPEEGDARVLYRVDGVLTPAATVRRKMASGVVSRIKIMADLDISERRVPQDGRFALTLEGRRVDIRVVTLPLTHGEGAVLRILDRSARVPGLELQRGDQQAQRRGVGDRANRVGQVDDAVRGAARAQRRPAQHSHDRGPRRAEDRRDQADADRPQGRRHV